ncbi:MAG: hypothetical protein ACP5PQ_07325, partial [Thermoproteota archaeon]
DNKTIGLIYEAGLVPIARPCENRYKGYWRRKARKLWDDGGSLVYKQRGRGESPFGSLTNLFGDRLKTVLRVTSYVRIGLRVVGHQLRVLTRIVLIMAIIFRHAPSIVLILRSY